MVQNHHVDSVNRLGVGLVASLFVASILLYGVVVAKFMGTVPGLLAAIAGALMVDLGAALWLSSTRKHLSRTAMVSAGAVTVAIGLVLTWWGTVQCVFDDPGCSAKFYGSVYGGISASLGGGAWMAYSALKKRVGPRPS